MCPKRRHAVQIFVRHVPIFKREIQIKFEFDTCRYRHVAECTKWHLTGVHSATQRLVQMSSHTSPGLHITIRANFHTTRVHTDSSGTLQNFIGHVSV